MGLDHNDLGLELSYQLFSDWWGKGFATEAVTAVLRVASDRSALRVVAITQHGNQRSRDLLTRLRFVEQGEFEEFGERQVLYALPISSSGG